MRKRKAVRQLSNFDLVIVQGCGHAIAEHLPRAFLHGFLPPEGFAVQPIVVQSDRRDGQLIPAELLLVLAVRTHIVQMPLVPDGAELVEHFLRPFIAGAAFADFINALTGAATVATAAQRADNAGDAESAILKLDFAECPRSRFIAASGVDLTETRTDDLFHIILSPFVLLLQSCQCCG